MSNDVMLTNDKDLSPADDVTVQPNVVTLTDNSQLITGITYVPNSLQITPGQPFTSPPNIMHAANSWTITLMAGRSESNQVASSFNTVCGGENHEYGSSGGGGTPSQLNFYFAVELQWKSSGQSGSMVVYLGQGSVSVTNNWWIGGSSINTDASNKATITINGAPYSLSGSQDSFNIG